MDYRDNRRRWTESHQVVHFYAGQWCTFTPALTPMSGNALLSLASLATVPVVGQIGAGAELFLYDDHPQGQGLEEALAPLSVEGDNFGAVRIKGDSMRPLKDGWLLFFRRDQRGISAECRNQLCIVKIADDGPMMVKELRWTKTPGRYNLLIWNADPIEDVALDWAAKVMDIRPR